MAREDRSTAIWKGRSGPAHGSRRLKSMARDREIYWVTEANQRAVFVYQNRVLSVAGKDRLAEAISLTGTVRVDLYR